MMAAKFNPVPFDALASWLVAKGFEPTVQNREVVYERVNHHESGLVVRVFTSCNTKGVAVRPKGKDAIRVCLVYRAGGKSYGVAKAKRVNRCGTTEAIFDRILSRMRTLYAGANVMAKGKRCSKCGAPCWQDSGKCVRHYTHTSNHHAHA